MGREEEHAGQAGEVGGRIMSAQFVHLVIKLYKLWTWSVSLLHSRSNASLSLTYALRNCFCDPHTFIIRIPSTRSPSPLSPFAYQVRVRLCESVVCVCGCVGAHPTHLCRHFKSIRRGAIIKYIRECVPNGTERNRTELFAAFNFCA